MPDYVRIVHVLSPLVFFGVPGLVAGILVGRWRKSWTAVLALIAVGIALSIGGLASIPDDPDDNGVGLGLAIATLANLATWIIGLTAATASARRRRRSMS
jgi:hypothetical protein